jgi:hypothetical protein
VQARPIFGLIPGGGKPPRPVTGNWGLRLRLPLALFRINRNRPMLIIYVS